MRHILCYIESASVRNELLHSGIAIAVTRSVAIAIARSLPIAIAVANPG